MRSYHATRHRPRMQLPIVRGPAQSHHHAAGPAPHRRPHTNCNGKLKTPDTKILKKSWQSQGEILKKSGDRIFNPPAPLQQSGVTAHIRKSFNKTRDARCKFCQNLSLFAFATTFQFLYSQFLYSLHHDEDWLYLTSRGLNRIFWVFSFLASTPVSA